MPHKHDFDYRGRLGLCICGAKHILPKGAKPMKKKKRHSSKWGKIGAPKSAKRKAFLRKIRRKR